MRRVGAEAGPGMPSAASGLSGARDGVAALRGGAPATSSPRQIHESGIADGAPAYPLPARYRGRLIAVEGIDGSGKSTQLHLLLRWLQVLGLPVHLTAWNSSSIVHAATKRGKRQMSLGPATFSLMHAADLADRLEREILPRLRAGHVVLADRWATTAFARDAARGCDPTWLRRLYAFAPRPQLTVYFRIPPDIAVTRILAGRPQLRHYEAGMDLGYAEEPLDSFRIFQQRVAAEYEALVQPERMRIIDATAPVAVQQQVFRRLAGRVGQIPVLAAPGAPVAEATPPDDPA